MSDIDHNKDLINKFYTAFQQKDASTMISCYAKDATFEDPAFGKLNGDQVRAMWSMLIERGGKELTITHKIIDVSTTNVTATWEAIYPFSQTLRMVHNKISAEFVIENGLIMAHKDHFNIWKWSSMALGLPGMLLGWSSFMKGKIRKQALKSLDKYQKS
jgi:uncharacterized protein